MAWDLKNIQKWSWREHPPGAIIKDLGNSRQFKTGGWRAFRPIRDEDKCNQCLLCFVFCPDSAVLARKGKIVGIDYDFCKGCGICAAECPKEAIQMIDETTAKNNNNNSNR